jgi:hypothetical protein
VSKQVFTAFVLRPAGSEIIVVRVPNHPIRGRWHAQRVINAVKAKLPLSLIDRDVVIVAGDPNGEMVALGSSPAAEVFIKAVALELSDYKWQSKELDI